MTDIVAHRSRLFVPWGAEHLVVVGLCLLAAAVTVMMRARLRAMDDRWLRREAAAILVGNELIAWGHAALHGDIRAPLQLCDLALMATVWALLSLRRSVSEVAYFWGLGGSLQAVLTPDLHSVFPDYWWVTFFVSHGGIVLSVIYLAVTDRVRPVARSVWRVWGLTNLYAAAAGLINWRFGTNYGYLAHKPAQPSLLGYFGPWPRYILVMEVAALALFALAYAPFVLARRYGQRANELTG